MCIHILKMDYTGWFEALVLNLRRLLGNSFGTENVNKVFFKFSTVSELWRFYVDVAFIIVIVSFYKIETFHINITFQLISLFAKKEKEKNSTLCSIFQLSLQSTSFWVLFCLYGGVLPAHCMYKTVHNHNRCLKCPPSTWIHASQWRWLYFHKCSVRSPCRMITIIQSDINVKTSWLRNSGESEKNIIYIFCSKWSPQQPP
jgi:hypothetical protein